MLSLSVPVYNSLPGAAVSLYIDFDGAPAFNWVGTTTYRVHGAGGLDTSIPAFSIDNIGNDFSQEELDAIGQIWSDVAEKYSPFNINVTTVVPPNFNNFQAVQLIVGGRSSDWLNDPTAVGVATGGGFSNSQSNQAFCFSEDIITPFSIFLSDADRDLMEETIAHEAGHLFGLSHQSVVDADGNVLEEYSNGNGLGVPIMGNAGVPSTANKHGIWFDGAATYRAGGNVVYAGMQDDLDHLYSLLGHRADDFGPDDGSFATNDNQGHVSVHGTIGSLFDTDGIRFSADGTSAHFSMFNHGQAAMLTPRMELRSFPGYNPVGPASTVITDNKFEMTFNNLVIGQQYVVVASSNFAYGSLGEYYIYGTFDHPFAEISGRVLFIHGGDNTNNDIWLNQYYSGQQYLQVSDTINGNFISRLFPYSGFDFVITNTGSGDDKVTYLTPIGSIQTSVFMGTGYDQLEVRGTTSSDFFDIGSGDPIDSDFQLVNFDNTIVYFYSSIVDSLSCYGYDGTDSFSISKAMSTQISLFGGEGNDAASVDHATLGTVASGQITFNGEGGIDGLYASDYGNTAGGNFVIASGEIISFVGTFPRTAVYNTVENVYLSCGSGPDAVAINGIPVGVSAAVFGNLGNDTFTVGTSFGFFPDPFSQLRGVVSLEGDGGDDRLIVDDSAYTGTAKYAIDGSSVRNTSVGNYPVSFDSTVEHMDFYGRSGNSSTTLTAPSTSTNYQLFGGSGGTSGLTFDDRPIVTQPFAMDLYPNRIDQKFGSPASFTSSEVQYSGYEALGVFPANGTHTISVYGTSPDITSGQQTTLVMGTGADTVTVFPHDAADNLTFPTPFGVGGGSGFDTFVIDDTSSASPIDYLFNNPFGAGTADIFGLGASGVGAASDVESIIVLAGNGDDTFTVDSFKSGNALAIHGGGGNDMLDITPTSMTLQSNITNASAFSFDGGDDSDAFNLHNANSSLAFTYNTNTTSLQAIAGGYGSFTFTHSNTESITVEGGANADVFNAQTVAAGQSLNLGGGGGSDTYFLGNAMRTEGIAGGVYISNSAGTDSISIDDRADTTGRTLHVDAGMVGATTGDDLFGDGGFLYYGGITGALTIKLGSGSDTAYVVPLSVTPLFVEANNPTVAAPGDFLGLAFANAVNPVFTPGVAGEGAYGFDNAAFFYYSGFESAVIDDAAPYIVAQSYDDAGIPTIVVQFSEDVSNALSVNYLELVNTTTTEQVPFYDLNLAYDTESYTASFTFPGYTDGILPPGEYTAKIYGSLPDQFGNVMGVETPFSFAVEVPLPALPGDYNLNGEVDSADYIVWRMTLGNDVAKYSGADGSGNGHVGPEDYDVWRANFGNSLPPLAATNEASFADAHAGTESMRGSAISMEATEIAKLVVPAVDSASIARELPTIFGPERESFNVASAAAFAYSGTGISSAFQAGGFGRARLTAGHFALPLTQPPTTVAGNRVVFDGHGRRFDNFEADNASAGLVSEAVDEVFEADWASVNSGAI